VFLKANLPLSGTESLLCRVRPRGDGDAESYIFTIKATFQHVREYYEQELLKRGWNQFATEERGDESLMLMFMNTDSATLTVSIISMGDDVLVL
jgi:hypothetical protein